MYASDVMSGRGASEPARPRWNLVPGSACLYSEPREPMLYSFARPSRRAFLSAGGPANGRRNFKLPAQEVGLSQSVVVAFE